MWAWGLGWTITLHTVLVPALLALGAGTLRVSREGAVSNEKTWRQRKGLQAKGCGSFGSWNREGGVLPASLQKEPALGPLQMPDLQTQEKKLCGFKLLSGDDLVATANSQDERGSPWMVLRGSGVGDIETPHYQISP